MNHIGTQTIETKRLILRKFEINDAEDMFNNWAKDPENVKYLTWNAHKNVNETKEMVSKWVMEYENQNYYRWGVVLKENSSVIGGIDVTSLMERIECCEIGYILSKKYWNNGFMTESLHAVLDFLFNKVGFHRIQIYHDVDNCASGRVIQKNGLKHEGILRKYIKNNSNQWVDVALYSILKHEFK